MDISSQNLLQEIKSLLHNARNRVIHTVNTTMVLTYFNIGKLIRNHDAHGDSRGEYGEKLLKQLSKQLTEEFGKGFSVTNLQQMRTFYQNYEKQQTVSAEFKLSWSHYVFLMRLNSVERKFYELEAIANNWSLRELKRQYDSSLFERLKLDRRQNDSNPLTEKGQLVASPKDLVKDPYILEFLGLKEESHYSESELEQAIIDKIEQFLLELGKGFAFIGRQQRFTFDEQHFFVDLVFYNRLLKCFVLIDLKIGDLKHQDLGQIQMYVNYYDRFIKTEEENLTIGIVLCKSKNNSLVEITLPEDNKQIFASAYQTYIPTKEEFRQQIETIDVHAE